MHVAVVGAGSLGSLLGGLLAREHHVTLVGRQSHIDAVARDGLRIEGEAEATVRPRATTDVAGLEVDLAVVAVKAYDTATAAEELARASVDAACSVQNGLGNEAVLAERLDVPILAGVATYGADLLEPGVVRCTGLGEVVLGPREGGQSPCADATGAAFDAAGVATTVADDLPRRLWLKLAVNAGVNPVTALTGLRNGALRSTPAGDVARDAARETARVATAAGVPLSPETAVSELEDVVDATAANRSSMLQDVLAGRRTEVDAINGAVVERAAELDVAVPVNRALAGFVHRWEEREGLREPVAADAS